MSAPATMTIEEHPQAVYDYQQVADAAGISANAAYRILGLRDRVPSWDVACRIADYLGISMDELRGRIETGQDAPTTVEPAVA